MATISNQPRPGFAWDSTDNVWYPIGTGTHNHTDPNIGNATGTSLALSVASGTSVPLTVTNNGTGNSFVVNDVTGDTSPFTIDAAGSVGVGTATPAYSLDVQGSMGVTGTAYHLNTITTAGGSDSGYNLSQWQEVSGDYAGVFADYQFKFNTGSNTARTEKMRIDNNGNVGIGKTPTTKLDVNGTITGTKVLGGGLDLIVSSSISAAATLSLNSCFTSTYTNYRIVFAGTNSGTKSNPVYFKLRASSTDSSVSYYGYNVNYFSSNATNNTITSNLTTGIPVGSCEDDVKFSFDVFAPQLAVQTGTTQMAIGWQSGSTRSFSFQGQGLHNVSTAYDGFTLNFTSATVTGTVSVYGYNK